MEFFRIIFHLFFTLLIFLFDLVLVDVRLCHRNSRYHLFQHFPILYHQLHHVIPHQTANKVCQIKNNASKFHLFHFQEYISGQNQLDQKSYNI